MRNYELLFAAGAIFVAGCTEDSSPVEPQRSTASRLSGSTQAITTADFVLVQSDGWALTDSGGVSFTQMHRDPTYGTWIWAASVTRTPSDVATNGGLNGIAIDYIGRGFTEPPQMMGVQRLTSADGALYAFADPAAPLGAQPVSFGPNTMPLAMTLPILGPDQMGTDSVTPGALQAFSWQPEVEYLQDDAICGATLAATSYTQNSFYLVADYPHGGSVGTPPLTLIMETEIATAPPNTVRLERYAFVPGFGRIWEEGFDSRTGPIVRSTWNVKVSLPNLLWIGDLCPFPNEGI